MEKSPSHKEVIVTEITPDDWEVLRDLKINSLDQEPLAFEDPVHGKEKYETRTEEEWRKRLDSENKDKFWLFAKDESAGKYIGAIFAHIENGDATIQHVFVDTEYRGQGIGKKLLSAILEKLQLRGDVNSVLIQVLITQKSAINLYHSLGFEDVKIIKDGAKRKGESYDEIEMKLDLEK